VKKYLIYAAISIALASCINPIADAIVGNGDEFIVDTVVDTMTIIDSVKVPPETIFVIDTIYCSKHRGCH
jgi:hypothetical protein